MINEVFLIRNYSRETENFFSWVERAWTIQRERERQTEAKLSEKEKQETHRENDVRFRLFQHNQIAMKKVCEQAKKKKRARDENSNAY